MRNGNIRLALTKGPRSTVSTIELREGEYFDGLRFETMVRSNRRGKLKVFQYDNANDAIANHAKLVRKYG